MIETIWTTQEDAFTITLTQEFLKEYTEGNWGGPGAVPPGKFLIFEVTQPYFFVFLNAKKVWKVHK